MSQKHPVKNRSHQIAERADYKTYRALMGGRFGRTKMPLFRWLVNRLVDRLALISEIGKKAKCS